MSYQKILISEIASIMDNLIEAKITIDPNAITNEICNNHSDELIKDAPFSTHNNYSNVRREVRSVMSKKLDFTQQPESQQLIIEGFEHVQVYYSIKRKGEQIGVPVEQMTEFEIREKAKELRKMGKTCFDHANELEMYYFKKLANA